MQFQVISSHAELPESAQGIGYLIRDNWNDWHKYWTQFFLVLFDATGLKIEAGSVKIACSQMSEGDPTGRTSEYLDAQFQELSEAFFSLGQEENYYESLSEGGAAFAKEVLTALRDIAFDLTLLDRFEDADVMGESLLRGVSKASVRINLHDRAHGRVTRTPFKMRYSSGTEGGYSPLELDFSVQPESLPPSNVHVIIGRNGAGKTFLLRDIAAAMVAPATTGSKVEDVSRNALGFRRVVSISFSAFDPFFELTPRKGLEYHYVGLHISGLRTLTEKLVAEGTFSPDDPRQLNPNAVLFHYYFRRARTGARALRWAACLQTLRSDPAFASAEVATLLGHIEQSEAFAIFSRFSSGHKVVLLSVMALVSLVEERTLVLIDEPEAHLHPPLLASLIRTLSNLLLNRNGAAVLATHSPLVLQEVPAGCTYKLVRSSRTREAFRPSFETFGESLSRLTSDVFGHEVVDSGFHMLIRTLAAGDETYDEILARFGGRLGAQARALLRLMAKDSNE